MGIFDLFKRKRPPTTDEKLNKMWELWTDGNLKTPCAKLMTYESEVNNGGHGQYFFNIANGGDLAEEVAGVLSMLPEPLRENLNRGYTAFAAQEKIDDDANEALFEECDDVFYEHEQIIIDMIYEFAKELPE